MTQPTCSKAANFFTNNAYYNFVGHNLCCGKTTFKNSLVDGAAKATSWLEGKPSRSPRYAKNNIIWGVVGLCGCLSLFVLGLSLRKPCGRIPSAIVATVGATAALVPLLFNIAPGVAVKIAIHR